MHERYWIILFNKKLQWHIQKGLKFLPGYSNAALRTCAKHKDRFDQIEKKRTNLQLFILCKTDVFLLKGYGIMFVGVETRCSLPTQTVPWLNNDEVLFIII